MWLGEDRMSSGFGVCNIPHPMCKIACHDGEYQAMRKVAAAARDAAS